MGCRAWRCGSPFSPADPGQSFFTHPTQRLRCNRLPGTRPFPRWRWRPNISWSFRACSFVPSRSSLDQSKRARVKEHRLSENTIGLVCRLPRAQEASGPPCLFSTPGGGASTVGLFAVTGPASYFRSVTFQPHCVHLRLDRHAKARPSRPRTPACCPPPFYPSLAV